MIEKQKNYVTRFAPSPNGWLHLGHAYSALLAARHANAHDGKFILRIEDIDTGRARPHFVDGIYQDLAWLGLTWPTPVLIQSARFDVYDAALRKLRARDLVYPCWASRRDIADAIADMPGGVDNWPRDPDGAPLYPGIYRDIDDTERQSRMWRGGGYAWRLRMDKAIAEVENQNGGPLFFTELADGQPRKIRVNAACFGDVVLARKDVPTSYHLSVVVDDAAQGITHITRGQDLRAATHIHRVLQVLLDLPAPQYFHHALIRDPSGRRLSKQAGDPGFRGLRHDGYSREAVIDTLPAPLGTGALL
tara:strand:+ start:370 stop:1284 length:915 start_codon:yes stop_codon:yes gene_type:complete